MKYDFDTPINRRGTSSFKWDTGPDYFGRDDVIPMWVADMDFACAPCIVEAVKSGRTTPSTAMLSGSSPISTLCWAG